MNNSIFSFSIFDKKKIMKNEQLNFFFYNDHDDSYCASWQVFLLWPAAACHSARLTSGSVRPLTASLCSPAGCWAPAGRSSQPSPALRGPGLALGWQPWRHTAKRTHESWRRTTDFSLGSAQRERDGEKGIGGRVVTLSPSFQGSQFNLRSHLLLDCAAWPLSLWNCPPSRSHLKQLTISWASGYGACSPPLRLLLVTCNSWRFSSRMLKTYSKLSFLGMRVFFYIMLDSKAY